MPDPRHPNHLLRAARGRRSQADLAEAANAEIARASAHTTGHGTPGALTAKYISDLERGRYTWPGQLIRDALCAVLRVGDPADLGFTPPRRAPWSRSLDEVLPVNGRQPSVRFVPISGDTVDLLSQHTDQLRRLDREGGARVDGLDALLSTTASVQMRRQVAAVLADAAALAGWQSVDAGDLTGAWERYELARRAANEADSPTLLTHAMGEQAYALVESGQVRDAITLVGAARAEDARLPLLLRCWLAAAHAEVLAIGRDKPAALAALGQAEKLLPASPDADLPYLSLDQFHLARWRGNILSRLGDSQGVQSSLSALASMDPSFVRARAGLLTDLAEAYTRRGELTDAQESADRATTLAQRVGSARLTRRLGRLVATIEPG